MKLTDQVTKAQVQNILAKLKAGKTITKREEQLVAAYEAGISPELTLEQASQHYGISRPGVLKWKRAMQREGIPFNSYAKIDEWRARKSKENQQPESQSAAKLKKTLLECERIELVMAQIKGELMERAAVKEACTVISATLAAELQNFLSDCVSLLDGVQGVQIREKIEPRINLLLQRTNERLAGIKPSIRGLD